MISYSNIVQYVQAPDCIELNPGGADGEEGSPRSLLEEMQLVEPWKHEPVPNHILETSKQ